ncbi:MAG: arylsulfatase [Verrucomicrobiota bacterium]
MKFPFHFVIRASGFFRHSLLLLLCTLLLGVCNFSASAAPNIIVFLSDDQGWGDLSTHGNSNLATPNVDSLGRDGALFERFFVCAVCSPTRAEFLTGRYHPRGGVYSTSTGGERLDLDEKTIAQAFKAAGYATAAFGKWHNGSQYPYHPNARGFDEYYGFTSGHWGSYFDPELEHNGKIVKGKGYITDDLTDHAMAFIEKNKSKPFFCYIPYNTPHSPMQVPDKFFAKFKDAPLKLRADPASMGAPKGKAKAKDGEDLEFTRAALAMCENIDWNVGRVLKKLDDLKLADNTIIVYFNDNGPNSWRWNDGMKGRKGSTDEGGVRSPLLVRWPGHIKPGTRVSQIAGAIDLLPTLTDLAGVKPVPSQPHDGVSLKPLLLGAAKNWPDRMIFNHWSGRVSVRTQQYRLADDGKLFDMVADPRQRSDVAAQHPDLTKRLAQAADAWRKELLPGLRDDQRAYPVGHREFPLTQLPARDGIPHGNVKRSAGAPNCSFFTNWKSPDDRITWDVEVATSGRYEVQVYYTCPKADVGSRFELTFNGARLEGKVSEAHDPPLYGMENDRTGRGSESYVKDFKPLNLGTVDLKAGRGELALKALSVPGSQVMDVRRLVLTLK